jgi:hypothetical protein
MVSGVEDAVCAKEAIAKANRKITVRIFFIFGAPKFPLKAIYSNKFVNHVPGANQQNKELEVALLMQS